MEKEKNNNIVIGILIFIIVALIILIGLMATGKINFTVNFNSKTNSPTNEVVEQKENEEKNTFKVTYQEEIYKSTNKNGYQITINKRNLPIIQSNKYQEQANKIVTTMTNYSNISWTDIKNSADTIAKENYESTLENLELGVSYLISTSLQTNNNISFNVIMSGSMGGVTWSNNEGYNFNIQNGELLEFNDITNNYNELVNLTYNEMVKFIQNQSYANDLNKIQNGDEKNWEDTLKEEMFKIKNWYFTSEGLKFSIPKYSIGPGYISVITNTISYEVINQYLKEEYQG